MDNNIDGEVEDLVVEMGAVLLYQHAQWAAAILMNLDDLNDCIERKYAHYVYNMQIYRKTYLYLPGNKILTINVAFSILKCNLKQLVCMRRYSSRLTVTYSQDGTPRSRKTKYSKSEQKPLL